MVNFEKKGKNLTLNTEEMTHLEFFNLFQPYLKAEELLAKIPVLGDCDISADDVEAGIVCNNKIWSVYKSLVENGLSVKATNHWFDTDHVDPCRDLKWLFSAYTKRAISPDDLARSFSGFLSRELLDDEENVKILLDLGVNADTLVRDVMTKEQITEHFILLYSERASIDLVIDTLGVFPGFYTKYPISYLVELGADLLKVSEYIFYSTQPYVDMEKYLTEMCHYGLNLTEFVSKVILAKNLHLYVVVQFPDFFTDRYVDVKSILKDVCTFKVSKTPKRRDMENKLIILANFSELASMGLIDEPKRIKKDWRWEFNQICRSIFEEVYDSHGYSYEFLLDVDDFEYLDESKNVDESVPEFIESVLDAEIPDFLKSPKAVRAMPSVDCKVLTRAEVPEMAPSVYER